MLSKVISLTIYGVDWKVWRPTVTIGKSYCTSLSPELTRVTAGYLLQACFSLRFRD